MVRVLGERGNGIFDHFKNNYQHSHRIFKQTLFSPVCLVLNLEYLKASFLAFYKVYLAHGNLRSQHHLCINLALKTIGGNYSKKNFSQVSEHVESQHNSCPSDSE